MVHEHNNYVLSKGIDRLLNILVANKDPSELGSSHEELISFWGDFDKTLKLQSKIAKEPNFSFVVRPRCESTDSESSMEYEPTLLDKHGKQKYNLKGKTSSGANGKVFREARSSSASEDKKIVVKEFNIQHNAQRTLVLALEEHHNLLAAGLETEIMFDPEHKKVFVTMPRFEGITVRQAIESRAATLVTACENKDNKTAYATAKEMFVILKNTLESLDAFHKKTKLVHGDAHLGNAIVNESNNNEVNLIDMGGCCAIGITAQQYKDSGIEVGGGGFYTAPEIPTTGNMDGNGNDKISTKSDLYSFVAEFVISGLSEIDGFGAAAANANSNKFRDIISNFTNWALLYVANSDAIYENLPKKQRQRLTAERNQLMVEHNVSSAAELRVDVATAIAKIESFIDRIEIATSPYGIKSGMVAARIRMFDHMPSKHHAHC